MEVRDWFILIFTFVVGLFAGMYLYVTAYYPIYGGVDDRTVIEAGEFSIIGVTYGGFTTPGYVHPSFRLEDSGAYDYFPGGETVGEKEEGAVPHELMVLVERAVAGSDLARLATPVSGKNCMSYADGIEHEYNIETAEGSYDLDTCTTVFSNGTALGQALLEVWRYLETGTYDETRVIGVSVRNLPRNDGDTGEWRGLRGFIEDRFIQAGFDTTF